MTEQGLRCWKCQTARQIGSHRARAAWQRPQSASLSSDVSVGVRPSTVVAVFFFIVGAASLLGILALPPRAFAGYALLLLIGLPLLTLGALVLAGAFVWRALERQRLPRGDR